MPRPGSRDAPTLTSEGTDDPMKVRRYFDDLENLFTECTIADDLEKKKWSIRYPDGQVSWEWKALPEFLDTTNKFSEFKRAVLCSYPGATDEERGTIRELNRLFKKHKNIDSSDLDEYLALLRKFRAIKLELNPPTVAGAAVQLEPLVTNRELVEKFTSALDPGFRSAIFSALHLKGKTRKVPAGQRVRQDDLYEIDDVIAQGEEIVRGTMPGTDPLSYAGARAISTPSASSSIVKTEQIKQQMDELFSEKISVLLDTIKISQEQLRQENSKQLNDLMKTFQQSNIGRGAPQGHHYQHGSGTHGHGFGYNSQSHFQNNRCFFCDEEGHIMNDCHHRQDLVELGRIILVNGRTRLPGNYPIPREPVGATCEKDRIDYYYAGKAKRETAQQVNLVQSGSGHVPGMIDPAAMSTYLSNQLDERELRIAQLEREMQSLRSPSSQMYNVQDVRSQFSQVPYATQPMQMPQMAGQSSQVGWTPQGQYNYMASMAPPMGQFLHQSQLNPGTGFNYGSAPVQHSQMLNTLPISQFVNQSPSPMQQQMPGSNATLAELEAFVQTRRQQESEQLEK
jgi:hypothetical protein